MKIFGEIGINHNGDVTIAKKLIDICSELKIEAVKFQKRDIYKVYDRTFLQVQELALGAILKKIKKRP